jgi:predicted DNA-binding protein
MVTLAFRTTKEAKVRLESMSKARGMTLSAMIGEVVLQWYRQNEVDNEVATPSPQPV